MTECPKCGHSREDHQEHGCVNGWEWGPEGGPSTKDGCDCPITGWVT